MKALILTGGLGTRLRPLTCTVPKPLLPVANVPFITHQILNLKRFGIRDVVLATGYRPDAFRRTLGNGRSLGVRIRYSVEDRPLGTGGAVRHARSLLGSGRTVILNGDVYQRLAVDDLLRRHRKVKADLSIALVRVEDPTQYGLVETEPSGRIRRFLEKPSFEEITCDTINAGAYVFEPEMLDLLPDEAPYSLERGLFPHLLEASRRLFGFVTEGYWMDIGTVEKFLQVHRDILTGVAPFTPSGFRRQGDFLKAPGCKLHASAAHFGQGQVMMGRGTTAGRSARFLGPNCLGAKCRIGEGAILEDCVILDGTTIGPRARLKGCLVGRNCRVGAHSHIGPGTALGDGTVVSEYTLVAS